MYKNIYIGKMQFDISLYLETQKNITVIFSEKFLKTSSLMLRYYSAITNTELNLTYFINF